MNRKVFFGFLAIALITALAVPGAWSADSPSGKIDAKAAFEKLKGLAGDWSGTAKEGIPATVTYRLSSNGTVVTEILFPGTEHEMMTLYYLQGNDLAAQHYCAIGNQPRFKLDLAKSTPSELVFAFDGGTNFDPAKDAHVHSGKIVFGSDGKLETAWAFYAGGEAKGSHDFHLARSAAK
jgi:hypothetical protein